MYGATSAGEHEAAVSTLDMSAAAAPTPAPAPATTSWVKRASMMGLGLLGLAGVTYSVGGTYGAASDDRLALTRVYEDDDVFTGHMFTWYNDSRMIDSLDPGTQFSCNDYDDDQVYPGRGESLCDTPEGDPLMCDTLMEYDAFSEFGFFGGLCQKYGAVRGSGLGVTVPSLPAFALHWAHWAHWAH